MLFAPPILSKRAESPLPFCALFSTPRHFVRHHFHPRALFPPSYFLSIQNTELRKKSFSTRSPIHSPPHGKMSRRHARYAVESSETSLKPLPLTAQRNPLFRLSRLFSPPFLPQFFPCPDRIALTISQGIAFTGIECYLLCPANGTPIRSSAIMLISHAIR